jgi:hypothetical protein
MVIPANEVPDDAGPWSSINARTRKAGWFDQARERSPTEITQIVSRIAGDFRLSEMTPLITVYVLRVAYLERT